jgi:hypothetical protein
MNDPRGIEGGRPTQDARAIEAKQGASKDIRDISKRQRVGGNRGLLPMSPVLIVGQIVNPDSSEVSIPAGRSPYTPFASVLEVVQQSSRGSHPRELLYTQAGQQVGTIQSELARNGLFAFYFNLDATHAEVIGNSFYRVQVSIPIHQTGRYENSYGRERLHPKSALGQILTSRGGGGGSIPGSPAWTDIADKFRWLLEQIRMFPRFRDLPTLRVFAGPATTNYAFFGVIRVFRGAR